MNAARNISQQMEPTVQVIGEYTFYIYPLPAFTAANLSGEVISLLSPLIGNIASAFVSNNQSEKSDKNRFFDMEVEEAAPAIAGAFSSLSADKMENLLRKLLMNGNVGVRFAGEEDAHWLNEDKCNEIFCGNVQNMFILAFYVIKVNYGDFFAKFGIQSGSVIDKMKMKMFPDMVPSMSAGSTN